MLIGVVVYIAADSGDIGYKVTDLHVSWIMCCTSAGMSLILFIVCLCIDIFDGRRYRSGYTPVSDSTFYDNTLPVSDDELMIDV